MTERNISAPAAHERGTREVAPLPFEVPYYDPWADLASRPEITYGRTFLPGGAGGLWFPDIPAITLDKRLTRVAARCVLAHELAHVDLRHGSCAGWGPGTARLARRQERSATALAARRLLPVTSIAAAFAEELPLADMAAELNVTESVLHRRLRDLNDDERTLLNALRRVR